MQLRQNTTEIQKVTVFSKKCRVFRWEGESAHGSWVYPPMLPHLFETAALWYDMLGCFFGKKWFE